MIPLARFVFAIAFSLFLLNTSPQVFAQTTTATAPAKVKKIPFHGTIVALDASAETITLNGKEARVLHVTPTTKITDGAGAASTFSTATVGEDVGGSYTKDASGTLSLASLRIGAKPGEAAAKPSKTAAAAPAAAPAPEPAPAAAPAAAATTAPAAAPAAAASTKVKKQTFSGTVVSVDSAASTMVVHGKADQTFTVTSSTKISGTATTFAALTTGSKISGSYSKAADGTLTVYTIKVK